MNIKKRYILSLSLALVCMIAGVSAYISYDNTIKSNKEPENINNEKLNNEIADDEHTMVFSPPIYYCVKSNENFLLLYEIDGEYKKIVKSFSYNPKMFPDEDKRLLESGINVDSLEESIKIIENFIS